MKAMKTPDSLWLVVVWLAAFALSLLSPVDAKPRGAQAAETSTPVKIEDRAEPQLWNPALRGAWQQFVRNGRYRLARLADMRFSEPIQNRLHDLHLEIWQSQYSTTLGLAVSVVDTKNPKSPIGIVLFRPVRKQGKIRTDAYTLHWLYQKGDLSRAVVHQVSGDLMLYRFNEDGQVAMCEIEWASPQRRYICR